MQTIAGQWGRAIRAQRTLVGMSQQALADACGVHQTTVSRWEHGLQAPSHHNIPAIAQALHTVPSVLFQYPQQHPQELSA